MKEMKFIRIINFCGYFHLLATLYHIISLIAVTEVCKETFFAWSFIYLASITYLISLLVMFLINYSSHLSQIPHLS